MRAGAAGKIVVLIGGCLATLVMTAALSGARAMAQSWPGNGSWSPPSAPQFGEGLLKDQMITMDDGVKLSANVVYPTALNSTSGVVGYTADQGVSTPVTNAAPAPGRFPVLIAATPYAKDIPGVGGEEELPDGFVPYGYVYVTVDVRGTGGSGGSFDLAEPREQKDILRVIDWASHLPESDGRVGMLGASYLAMTSELAAGNEHPGSPLKAIFSIVGPSEIYRDLVLPGGILDSDFVVPYTLGFEVGLDAAAPVFGPPDRQQLLAIERAHVQGNMSTDGSVYWGELVDGPRRYDSSYWRQRQAEVNLGRIAGSGVAAFIYNSWFDIWQRGDARVYDELQNGYAGRVPDSPMLPNQNVDPRLQTAIGPYTHAGTEGVPPDDTLALEWFDTWLKGINTGMADTQTPLHLYEVDGGRWVNTSSWPPAGTHVQTIYFSQGPTGTATSLSDGALSTTRSPDASADTLPWWPATSPCSRMTDQDDIAGVVKGYGDDYGLPQDPCFFDDRTLQANALTYTSQPLSTAVDIAGPSAVTIRATANRPETEWVATLDDVGPDGSSRPLATGDLLGSFRRVRSSTSWTLDGKLIAPDHPFTQASRTAVTPGVLTTYKIEIPAILARIAAGHRLRVTVTSSDTPYLLPSAPDQTKLRGGMYDVLVGGNAGSSINIPMLDPSSLTTSSLSWGNCNTDC